MKRISIAALAAILITAPAMACSPAPSCWMEESPEYLRGMCNIYARNHMTAAQIASGLDNGVDEPKKVPSFVKACGRLHVPIGRLKP